MCQQWLLFWLELDLSSNGVRRWSRATAGTAAGTFRPVWQIMNSHTHTLNTSPVRLRVWITPPPLTEAPLFSTDLLMLSLALANKMDDHRSAVGRGVCGQHRPGLSTLQRKAVISPWSKTSPHYTQTLTSSVIGDTTRLFWRLCKKNNLYQALLLTGPSLEVK